MEMDENNWHENVNLSLQDEENRLAALMEIKTHLSVGSHNQLQRDANHLQLPLLFDCLNTSNPEQVDLACEILTTCMENLSIGETTVNYSESLVRALNHPKAKVRMMALKEIERSFLKDEFIPSVFNDRSLMDALFQCVSGDQLEVAVKASSLLVKIGKTEMGLTRLLQKPYVDEINAGLQFSDLVRFRIYQMIVEIARNNASSLQALVNAGWIGMLISELTSDDILLQLNALEILADLAANDHGRQYIESQELLKKMASHLGQSDETLSALLLPGLIKFFGSVAYWDPLRIFQTYENFSKTLFNLDNFTNPSLFGVTLDTIGHIGSTSPGKQALNNFDLQIRQILNFLSKFIVNLGSEQQARVLECFVELLQAPNESLDISKITEKWYQYMNNGTPNLIFKYAKIPFPEVKIASYRCIRAIADQIWGQAVILQTPGMMEFLLDRTIDNTKLTKDVIYDTIKCLATSELLNTSQRELLEKFVKDGPYYSDIRTEIAIEANAS